MKETDGHGNVKHSCGEFYSPSLPGCPSCCKHNNLEFDEDWHCGWNLSVRCSDCGDDWSFSNEDLKNDYKIVRR